MRVCLFRHEPIVSESFLSPLVRSRRSQAKDARKARLTNLFMRRPAITRRHFYGVYLPESERQVGLRTIGRNPTRANVTNQPTRRALFPERPIRPVWRALQG